MMVMRRNGFDRKERVDGKSDFDFGFGFSFDLGNWKSFSTCDNSHNMSQSFGNIQVTYLESSYVANNFPK